MHDCHEIKSNVEDNGYIQLGKGAVAQSRFSYGRDCQRSTSSIVNNNIAIGDKSDASKYTKSENDIYNNDYVLKEALRLKYASVEDLAARNPALLQTLQQNAIEYYYKNTQQINMTVGQEAKASSNGGIAIGAILFQMKQVPVSFGSGITKTVSVDGRIYQIEGKLAA